MAHFAGRRDIGVKFPMRAASVDPKSTQLTPLTIADLIVCVCVCVCFFQTIGQTGGPGRREALQGTSVEEAQKLNV